jgi:hypothetical protein
VKRRLVGVTPEIVLVVGVETTVYDAAPTALGHVRSMKDVVVAAAGERLAGGSERVILDAEVVVPPDPLELTAATVNVYTVPAVSPVNVPPDASVWVVVVGDDVTSYDVAPVDAGHVRSIVVVNGLLVVTLATAGESVYTAEVVAVTVPDPDALIDVIVNVYWIPAVRPVNVYAPPTDAV